VSVRAIFAWPLVVGGILLITTGLYDAGTSWWDQYQAAREDGASAKVNSSQELPRGFAAKLTIPRLASAVYVVEGRSRKDFRRGPGYIEGSSRPGEDGNCIIAGHRDLHFRVLKNIKVGDEITIESPGRRFSYLVSSVEVVSPRNKRALLPMYARQLTLVTCYPFYYVGPAPERFIVRAVFRSN